VSFRLHGTAVSAGGRGVLIRGPSGAGKSDLALRLIDRGAALIADDTVILVRHPDGLMLSGDPAFAGQIELRGLGIGKVRNTASARLSAIVDLRADPPRFPLTRARLFGPFAIPFAQIDPRAASAPILVELLLNGAVLPLG
jgi:hypothetical protein